MQLIFLNTPDLLDAYWDGVQKCINHVVEKAAHGEFDSQDLRRLCDEKRAYAAAGIVNDSVKIAFVFEFIYYPKMIACNIIALGGDCFSDLMRDFFVTFKNWCKDTGITVIEASCSSSMARLLSRYGYAKVYEVVRCDLITANS